MQPIEHMTPTCSISIPPVQRRYRVVADDASSVRLVVSRPKDHGSISLSVSRFAGSPDAMNACLATLIFDFEADFAPAMARFDAAYRTWAHGRPGVRLRCKAARDQAERLGNALFELIRGYARAYLHVIANAQESGIALRDHEVPVWLDSGIDDVQDGHVGWMSLEQLINGKKPRAAQNSSP